jgi:hypothetical protein
MEVGEEGVTRASNGAEWVSEPAHASCQGRACIILAKRGSWKGMLPRSDSEDVDSRGTL